MKLKKKELILALLIALLSFTALSGYSIFIGTIFNADLELPGLYISSNGALVMNRALQGTFYGLNVTLEPGYLFFNGFFKIPGLTNPGYLNFIHTNPKVVSYTDPGLYAPRCLELGGLRTVTGWSLFGRLMLRNDYETTGIDGRICQKEFLEGNAFAGFDAEMCGFTKLACYVERSFDGFKKVPTFIGCVGLKSVYMVKNCNICLEGGGLRSTWRSSNSNLPDFYGGNAKKSIKPEKYYDIRVGSLKGILGTCNTAFSTTTTTPTTTLTTILPTTTTLPSTTTAPTTLPPTTAATTLLPTTTVAPILPLCSQRAASCNDNTDCVDVCQCAYQGWVVYCMKSMDNEGSGFCDCYKPGPDSLLGEIETTCPFYLTANLSLSIDYGFSILGRDLLLLGSGNRFTGRNGVYLTPPLNSPPTTVIETCGGFSAFPRVFVEDFNPIPGNTTRTEWTLLGSVTNLYLGPGVNSVGVGLLNSGNSNAITFISTRVRFSGSIILKSINGVSVNPENSTNTTFLLPAINFSNSPSTTLVIEITTLQGPLTIGIDGGTIIDGM